MAIMTHLCACLYFTLIIDIISLFLIIFLLFRISSLHFCCNSQFSCRLHVYLSAKVLLERRQNSVLTVLLGGKASKTSMTLWSRFVNRCNKSSTHRSKEKNAMCIEFGKHRRALIIIVTPASSTSKTSFHPVPVSPLHSSSLGSYFPNLPATMPAVNCPSLPSIRPSAPARALPPAGRSKWNFCAQFLRFRLWLDFRRRKARRRRKIAYEMS